MKKPAIAMKPVLWLLFVLLALYSVQAFAAIDNVGVLNRAHDKFEEKAELWGTVMMARATWLFWVLTTISMVWTFGFMALRKADIGEFFGEFIRFTLFTGFFWWLLENGPKFAVGIMKSMRQIGAEASGLPNDLGPSGIVDVGFDIFYKVLEQSTIWDPMESLFGMFLALAILIVFALVGTNMLLLLVSGYFLAYAGVFILGFGGSKWTSDMAIGYYKSILNLALQLMTMILIIGVGRSFLDDYYTAMSVGISLKELGVMAVVAAVLLFLVAKVPPQIGALAGGTAGNFGSNFGVGAAVSTAAMGAAAIASAGAALAAGAASTAGGAQALMAAFSKANSAESAGGGASALMNAASGAGSDPGSEAGGDIGGSPLATAMGDSSGGRATPRGSSVGDSGLAGESSSNGGGASLSAESSNSRTGSSSSKTADTESTGSGGKSASGRDGGSPGEAKPARPLATAGAMAAKAGRIAAGAAVNLAEGAWDSARQRAGELKDSVQERVADKTGGKIAAAIEARQAADGSGSEAGEFNENSLAAGVTSSEFEEEIAAFRGGRSEPR